MNYPMTRSSFRLIRGVQNEIEFFVRNIDRQAVVLATGASVAIDIVDPVAKLRLLTRALSVTDATRGLFRLTLTIADTVDWNLGTLQFSVTLTRPDFSQIMLWTDRDYGPYSTLEVLDGPYLAIAAATPIDPHTFTFDSGLFGGTPDPSLRVSGAYPGSASLGYPNGMHTVAATLTGFTGVLTMQGTLLQTPASDADWFTVAQGAYVNTTGTQVLNAQGNFLWVRFAISGSLGSVDQLLYKN